MKEFKIRASACGNIMKDDRSGKGMGETAKTYVKEWYKAQLYGRRKEISVKYTMKGNVVEDGAIDFATDVLDWPMVFKNDQNFENDFMTGSPDIILADCVPDIKSSWDVFTFPLLETKIPNDLYYWQLQIYMELTGKNKALLVYCLMDTPDYLIENEIRSLCWKHGYDADDIRQDVFNKMTYGGIDKKLRIKTFEIARNPADISRIYTRVAQCREYLKTIEIK